MENPFVKTSKAGVGMYVGIFAALLNLVGIDIDEGLLTEGIFLLISGLGLVLMVIGQIDRKDLKWGIFRK